MYYPHMPPPPIYKSWADYSPKRKSNMGIKFINKALSKFDLIDWVKKLGIKHFRGIYSRDKFDMGNKSVNNRFIINYFRNI